MLGLRLCRTRVIVGIAASWYGRSLNNPILPRGRCFSQVSRTSIPTSTCAYLNGIHPCLLPGPDPNATDLPEGRPGPVGGRRLEGCYPPVPVRPHLASGADP